MKIVRTLSLGMLLLVACAAQPKDPLYQGKTVSQWVRQLQDTDMNTSLTAAHALQQIGTDGIPFLVKDLGKPARGLGSASSILAVMGADSIAAYLVVSEVSRVVASRNRDTRKDAIFILGQIAGPIQLEGKRNHSSMVAMLLRSASDQCRASLMQGTKDKDAFLATLSTQYLAHADSVGAGMFLSPAPTRKRR